MALKGTATSSYRSQRGTRVFVYNVTGSNAELGKFKEAQGDNYRETDTGVPLFFFAMGQGRSPKPTINLVITTNNRVVIDDTRDVLAREALIDQHMITQQAIVRAEIAEGVRTITRTGVSVPTIPVGPAPTNAPGAGIATEDSTVAELEAIGEGAAAAAGTEELGS